MSLLHKLLKAFLSLEPVHLVTLVSLAALGVAALAVVVVFKVVERNNQ